MAPNTSETIQNMSMGYENHYLIAATDHVCSDADLFIRTNSNSEIGKDTSVDATPIIRARTFSSELYKVKLQNVLSSGKSFAMVAVLTS